MIVCSATITTTTKCSSNLPKKPILAERRKELCIQHINYENADDDDNDNNHNNNNNNNNNNKKTLTY